MSVKPAAGAKTRKSNYDSTAARRQAKRRAQFRQMQQALQRIEHARSLDEAQAIAREGLYDPNAAQNAACQTPLVTV